MKNKTNYWLRDDIHPHIKGQNGEFISFKTPGITIPKKQDELCDEVLDMLNRKYNRKKKE